MKYALRTLWKDRGFAAMAVLSLALGIGANTAIFSLVNGVLLRPLDYPEPERLVSINLSTPQYHNGDALPINIAQLVEWPKRSSSFESIGGYRNASMSLSGDGRPEMVSGAVISANFFDVLGVKPRLGRNFTEAEDHFGQHRVVILSDGFWRRRFGGDPSIVGKPLMMGGAPYTIVGVLGPDFQFPKEPADMGKRLTGNMELFRPIGYQPDDATPHLGDLNYGGVGRLRAGVSIERARTELAAVEKGLDPPAPTDHWIVSPLILPLQQKITGDIRQSLIVLMAAVGAVLLVLCVNLANLSLSRAAGRARESAIRTALGAGRWQLARQSLGETCVLALLGGGLGVGLAYFALQRLLAVAPMDLPRLGEVTVDTRVLLFALGLSAVTAVLFGILPALKTASSSAPYETLKSTNYANAGGLSGLRLRNLLVALEVGLCAALLVTAGLFLSSFVRLNTIPRGFDIERVLAVDVALSYTKYTKKEDVTAFYQRLLTQTRALPGVEAASVTSYAPMQGESWMDELSAENDPDSQHAQSANLRFISPGYFSTLKIPLKAGRDFLDSDRNRMVAVISDSLAKRLWPNQDAIGRRLLDMGKPHEVIGVVGDARSTSIEQTPVNMLYIPLWQRPQNYSSVLIRTAMDPKSIASAVRAAVWSVDSDVPVPQEHTLQQMMSESLARRRFQMTLVVLFAMAALALAAFGTYGVVSYTVARRRAEIGIRMALGAGQARVLRLVLRQGMTPVFVGLAGGALAALAIGSYVSTLLFEVSPHDPMAFGLTCAVLLGVSAMACWIPARRASAVNPLEAIRYE